eukprot:TRINITY_DN2675_c0_g2_i1.p1 TRINITY_DN2675_c0_g2~~TRINITY_DN2675_c0_g2_i1.p1  ORF type:complete len:210 (+),score=7.14 TRINITY_DN2675_c0_g2_i1:1231-1860(+)
MRSDCFTVAKEHVRVFTPDVAGGIQDPYWIHIACCEPLLIFPLPLWLVECEDSGPLITMSAISDQNTQFMASAAYRKEEERKGHKNAVFTRCLHLNGHRQIPQHLHQTQWTPTIFGTLIGLHSLIKVGTNRHSSAAHSWWLRMALCGLGAVPTGPTHTFGSTCCTCSAPPLQGGCSAAQNNHSGDWQHNCKNASLPHYQSIALLAHTDG